MPNQHRIVRGNVAWIEAAIANANALHSALPQTILDLDGMSSPRVRHFLNHLLARPERRYLEVGSWKGSTLISALWGNEHHLEHCAAIDNFSEFGGPRDEFWQRVRLHIPKAHFEFHDCHAFKVDLKSLGGPFNTYFYDGNHDLRAQFLALTYFKPVLTAEFILVVDDWNAQTAQVGTRAGLHQIQAQVVQEWILPAKCNGDLEGWWNGLYVAVVRHDPQAPQGQQPTP